MRTEFERQSLAYHSLPRPGKIAVAATRPLADLEAYRRDLSAWRQEGGAQ